MYITRCIILQRNLENYTFFVSVDAPARAAWLALIYRAQKIIHGTYLDDRSTYLFIVNKKILIHYASPVTDLFFKQIS